MKIKKIKGKKPSQLFIGKYIKEKYKKRCLEILNLKYKECGSNKTLGYLTC